MCYLSGFLEPAGEFLNLGFERLTLDAALLYRLTRNDGVDLQMWFLWGSSSGFFTCFTFWNSLKTSPFGKSSTRHPQRRDISSIAVLQQIGIVRSSIASIRLRVGEAEPHCDSGEVTTWIQNWNSPETNSKQVGTWKIIGFSPKRKGESLPTIHFSGANRYVSFREGKSIRSRPFLEPFLICSGQSFPQPQGDVCFWGDVLKQFFPLNQRCTSRTSCVFLGVFASQPIFWGNVARGVSCIFNFSLFLADVIVSQLHERSPSSWKSFLLSAELQKKGISKLDRIKI